MARGSALVLLVALAACGDNSYPVGEPLAPAHALAIVAAPGDDLRFLQPDLDDDAVAPGGVATLYITSGTTGTALGLEAAYDKITGGTLGGWTCGVITLAGQPAQHCRNDAKSTSLVFLDYPDGGVNGEAPDSLLQLWEGNVTSVDGLAEPTAHYDQAQLIASVAAVITATQPTQIRTLEVAATHGDDDSDHMMAGALAWLGAAAASSPAPIEAYRGTNISDEPMNLPLPLVARSEAVLAAFDATALDDVSRRYAIGTRTAPETGLVTDGTSCAQADADGTVNLVACTPTTTPWTFAANGTVAIGNGNCLQVLPTGELGAGDCTPGPTRSFRFDDDGHIWVGTPPAPVADMAFAHLLCLAGGGGKVHAVLCGDLDGPIWAVWNATVTTARTAVGLTATGRAVRLADFDGDGKADLCTDTVLGLMCATGDGTGNFAAAVRVDSAAAPLTVEPTSLVIGDVDGDGRPDACGRDQGGLACVLSTTGYVATRFSAQLAATGQSNAADVSLAIVEHQICALAIPGVICIPVTAPDAPVLLSSYPISDAPVWIGDLDGDGSPDWCTATAAGPACGLQRDIPLTTAGSPWGYSIDMLVEGSMIEIGTLADDNTGALADVTGDGRADFCTLLGDQIGCAPSSGRGFDPRIDSLELPTGSAPDSLWLGDLDGDGKADICVADAMTISCVRSP